MHKELLNSKLRGGQSLHQKDVNVKQAHDNAQHQWRLVISEMQAEATMRYNYIPKMAKILS